MNCNHPRQPDPWNAGELLPCASTECTPDPFLFVIETGTGFLVNPASLSGAVRIESLRVAQHKFVRRHWPPMLATTTGIFLADWGPDSFHFWGAGDEAEQALCGEAFDLAREKARLEAELVLRDQLQQGKPKYLVVNDAQLAALAKAGVKGVVALTKPFTFRHRAGGEQTHFPGLIEVAVIPPEAVEEFLGLPLNRPVSGRHLIGPSHLSERVGLLPGDITYVDDE